MTKITIRPSARPLAHSCPSSILPPSYKVDRPTEARALGLAAHECAQHEVKMVSYEPSAIAAKHGADVAELTEMIQPIRGVIEKLRPYLRNPFTEYRVEGPLGGGSIDLLQDLDDCHVIFDYKSGWVRVDARPQLMAYAHALRHGGRTMPFKIIPIHLRYGTYDVYDVGDDELAAFEARDAEVREQAGEVYNPGDGCGYCNRRHECDAYRDEQRNAADALVKIEPGAVSRETLLRLYPQYQLATKALEAYKDAVRRAAADEPLVAADGSRIELQQLTRDEIAPKKAWAILKGEEFTDEDMQACLSIRKGAMTDIIKARAGKGRKQKDANELVAKLRGAGAIVKHPYRKLRFSKPKPVEKTTDDIPNPT